MSYKTGGTKTKFEPLCYSYGPSDTYTVYAALEHCSDIMVYVIINDKTGKESDISFGCEDDCAHGKHSLIDVMYTLKHKDVGTHKITSNEEEDIVIEEMTWEEVERIFNNGKFEKPVEVKLSIKK